MLGEGEKKGNVGGVDLGAAEGEGAQRGGERGKQAVHVGFPEQAVARGVAVEVQVDQPAHGRVGGEEVDDAVARDLGASAEIEVGQSGAFGDRGERSVGDPRVRYIQMRQLRQPGQQPFQGGARERRAFVQAQPSNAQRHPRRRGQAGHGSSKSIHERDGGRATEVDGPQFGKAREQLAEYIPVDVMVEMLLQQDFLDRRSQLEALQQRLRGHVLDFRVHLAGTTQAHRGEVREVEPSHDGAQPGIRGQALHELGENRRVRDGDVVVQRIYGRNVDGA